MPLYQDPTVTTAIPNGAPLISYPLAPVGNYAKVYSQPFVVASGYDSVGTIGSTGFFPGTYLVEETDRTPLGGGFFEFRRTYAEIPSGHDDFQTITYSFPAMQTWRPYPYVATVTTRIRNDFFLTGAPQGITLSGAQVFQNSYGYEAPYLSNTTTPTRTSYSGWVTSGVEFLAQDSQLSRFIGPIFRRESFLVKAR